MRLAVTPTPALRAICFAGFIVMVVQVLYLAEPNFALAIVNMTWDKAVHFTYFGTMAFLLWIASGKRWPLAVWLAIAAIGATDETLQAFTPGRTSDFFDWLADALGAAAALTLAQRIVPLAGSRAAAPYASRTGGESCVES